MFSLLLVTFSMAIFKYKPEFMLTLSLVFFTKWGMGMGYWPVSVTASIFIDLVGLFLIFLSLFMILMVVVSNFPYKDMAGLFSLLLLILFVFFSQSNFLNLYMSFELSLVPIFMVILGWGYQTERVGASVSLLFYTMTASMPLLFMLLFLMKFIGVESIIQIMGCFVLESGGASLWVGVFLSGAFLVKVPIFLSHFWLPKAHVEAPVEGSMILAAVLLKLGGVGLIRVAPLVGIFTSEVVVAVALGGAALVSFLCVRQVDMKVLIAYTSVAHMGLMIAAVLSYSKYGFCGGVALLVAHGVCSSMMFYGANINYMRLGSRSMVLCKGVLSWTPSFSMMWFIIMVGSMAGPPTSNLVAEVLCIISIISYSGWTSGAFFWMCILAASYSLVLYSSLVQPFFLSVVSKINVSIKEGLLSFVHVWWVVMIIVGFTLL